MRWELVLERKTLNKLNPETTRKKIRLIAAAAERNTTMGFRGIAGHLRDPERVIDEGTRQEVYRYLVRIRLEKESVRSTDAAQRQFEHVRGVVSRCAESQGWSLVSERKSASMSREAATPEKTVLETVEAAVRPVFVIPDLTDEVLTTTFAGIYEREQHIRVVHDAVLDYVDTTKKNKADPHVEVARSHILLKGKPAGAKTTLYERFKTFYETGSPVERVTFVDATTASKAGLENWLLDRAESGTLAEIIVLEEIEKQPLDNLLTLVSLMGSGYVAKLNARVGHRKELANCLIWATCNEESIIRNFRNGVLWSRFAHKLHCTRPSRELMKRILLDKVENMGGNPAWVDAVLTFAYETMPMITDRPMDDPRELKGLLNGRDRLLDGSYQVDLLKIMQAEAAEMKADAERESH